jgi:hypothetical protein
MSGARDINLVLVTGAGASRSFGRGAGTLPLMTDWATQLIDDLKDLDPAYPSMVGLERKTDGEQFEGRLGEYLRSARLLLREYFPIWRGPIDTAHLTREERQCRQFLDINDVIYDSIYRLFGTERTDSERAARALKQLLTLILGGVPPRGWVYATTNFDTLAEDAVNRLGAEAKNGEEYAQRGFRRVSADRMVQAAPSRGVPVLHLHGRVGWIRRSEDEEEEVVSLPLDRHLIAAGTPLVVLPDLKKTYYEPLIAAFWLRFEEYLARAQRVFVLGHSLRDRALVNLLRAEVRPGTRLAITYCVDVVTPDETRGAPAATAFDEKARLAAEFPEAVLVPMMFTADRDLRSPEFEYWLTCHAKP